MAKQMTGAEMVIEALKDQGVDWAYDEYNKPLVTDAMKAKVEAAKADIIAGKIQVHDYVADNACPAS